MKQSLLTIIVLLIFLTVSPFAASSQLAIQTGKSYINVNKPTGGIIERNDELEIRAVISVTGGTIYFVRYNDTIPAGTTYKPNSIRFTTNEGMVYGTPLRPTGLLTDAGGDDEATCSGGVLRVNVGSLTRSSGQTAAYDAVAVPAPPINVLPSATGCTIYSNGRPSFYGGTVIIMITYRVIVNALPGNSFSIAGGAFRYKTANTQSEITLPSIIKPMLPLSVMVTTPQPVCNSTGANSIVGSGGNYGSGTTQNLSPAPAPGTVVPGYMWRPFGAPAPGSPGPNDSAFTVANNTSTNGSTNNALPYPSSPARLFGVWDIIGDHTNAIDPIAGNPATPVGTNGGYMAVVNAAYGINNAVQQTITGLCPDTYYEFSAWFRNICRRCSCDTSGKGSGTPGFKNYMAPAIPNTNDSAGVLPNLTFLINGMDYYTTGNLSYNGRWEKKGFLYKTGSAETSVTIIIRNNAPGGGGNDWVMDDVSFATCLPDLTMRPSPIQSFCRNGQVNMSVIINSYYSNYKYYRWERSTDGGTTWHNAPLKPGVDSFTYTFISPDYKDTVFYPSIIASAATAGHKYRVRVATSISNLSNNFCSVYNTTNVITINVNNGCDVLPVVLINFKGQQTEEMAKLQWQTTKEINHQYFDVERSEDGVQFTVAGRVNSMNANSDFLQTYNFNDPEKLNGKTWYRLKMVSENGTIVHYSGVIALIPNSKQFEIHSLQNPVEKDIRFQLYAPHNNTVELQVLDIAGKICFNRILRVTNGTNSIVLPAAITTGGTYYLVIKTVSGNISRIIHIK